MSRFATDFAAFVGSATLCAIVTVATITSACQSARVGYGGDQGSEHRRENGLAGARPQDGLSHPVNTGRHTGGKLTDLYAARARVAGGSPGLASAPPVSTGIQDLALSPLPAPTSRNSEASVEGHSQGVRSVPAPEASPAGFGDPGRGPALYEVTSYSHGCVMPRSGIEGHAQRGANGRWPVADVTVAADTSVHPFGTEVLIEGLGFRTVGDRGHAIKGRRLDLFVDSCREARAFGRRWLRVYAVPEATTREARR